MKELFVGLTMAVVAAIAVPTLAQTIGGSQPASASGHETVVERLPPLDER